MVNSESMSPRRLRHATCGAEPQAVRGSHPCRSDRQRPPLLFHQAVQGDADTGGFLDVFFRRPDDLFGALSMPRFWRTASSSRTEHLVEIRLLAEHRRRQPVLISSGEQAARAAGRGTRGFSSAAPSDTASWQASISKGRCWPRATRWPRRRYRAPSSHDRRRQREPPLDVPTRGSGPRRASRRSSAR